MIRDLIDDLPRDPWRRGHPFSPGLQACHEVLFRAGASRGEMEEAINRWLALALELALAADILRTVMIPTWDEIGKLGAIVVLRTVLNYFLEREIEQEQKKAEYVLESAA